MSKYTIEVPENKGQTPVFKMYHNGYDIYISFDASTGLMDISVTEESSKKQGDFEIDPFHLSQISREIVS